MKFYRLGQIFVIEKDHEKGPIKAPYILTAIASVGITHNHERLYGLVNLRYGSVLADPIPCESSEMSHDELVKYASYFLDTGFKVRPVYGVSISYEEAPAEIVMCTINLRDRDIGGTNADDR